MGRYIKVVMYGWMIILAIFATCLVFAGVRISPVVMDSVETTFQKIITLGNKGYVVKTNAVEHKTHQPSQDTK